MQTTDKRELAGKMADLTFRMLEDCTLKQEYMAEREGLSISEFRCLHSFQSDHVMNIKEIAHRMGLTSSRLTRILDGLVLKRFVKRTTDKNDRRVINISLTEKGLNLVNLLNGHVLSVHEDILSTIPVAIQNDVINALQHLANAMNTWRQKVK
jgi:DNA-binding MarR family transcriptional regulator